jgi:hypothetical protein
MSTDGGVARRARDFINRNPDGLTDQRHEGRERIRLRARRDRQISIRRAGFSAAEIGDCEG